MILRPLILLTAFVLTVDLSAADLAKSINQVTVGEPVPYLNTNGDTWVPVWMRDGEMVTPVNDGRGFGTFGANVTFCSILGNDPLHLTGKSVNQMREYGAGNAKGPDGCTWKSSGCIAVDGVVYLVIGRHKYGEESGDPHMRQPAHNSTIIKSADGGKTWSGSAQESYDHPMFPGSAFATPYFVDYGQDGHEAVADESDRYIYALSNGGFWDNSDSFILGRVRRGRIGNLSAADWQYWAGDGKWVASAEQAKPVLEGANSLGSTGATYLPQWNCYFMAAWHYPDGGGKVPPNAYEHTQWEFYTAPHVWGPWKKIGSHEFQPQGYYCPHVVPKFTSPDGKNIWIMTSGNWRNGKFYCLTLVPLQLD